jgi:serine/threonine-protein phosphatase 2A regulatory subunit A
MIEEYLMQSMKKASEDAGSWRLRFAVAEVSGNVSKNTGRELSESYLVPILESLLKDGEPEVRSEAVTKICEVGKNISSEVLIEKLLPPITGTICTDTSQHTRGSLASSICQIAECLSSDESVLHLIPTIIALLKDEATEVRLSLMSNIKTIV